MWIMTKDGWKQLSPRSYVLPGHTPSLLERMGVAPNHNPVKALAEYANGKGNGVYFHYNADGSVRQIRGAINPTSDMLGVEHFD